LENNHPLLLSNEHADGVFNIDSEVGEQMLQLRQMSDEVLGGEPISRVTERGREETMSESLGIDEGSESGEVVSRRAFDAEDGEGEEGGIGLGGHGLWVVVCDLVVDEKFGVGGGGGWGRGRRKTQEREKDDGRARTRQRKSR